MNNFGGDGANNAGLAPVRTAALAAAISGRRVRGKWAFLFAFVSSCFMFWWLRTILLRFVLHLPDTADDSTIAISAMAVACFIAGYLMPVPGSAERARSTAMLDACGQFAATMTIALAFPSFLVAALVLRSHLGIAYGSANPIPGPYQAILYTHLFFGFMCIGAAEPEKQGWRRVWTASILITMPRLIISLLGGRFFLAQAVVPIVLIALARGWIRPSAKRLAQIGAVVLFLIFVPAITRGDDLVGSDGNLQMFINSDVLGLFQDNMDLSLDDRCPPLLISLTAKTVPWGLLGECQIDSGGLRNMPATLERILTNNDPGSFHGTAAGTGSNYLLELYVTDGLFAVYAGSALFGFSCRRFVGWIGRRSLFAGIWVECLTRALLAPRGNLGYVYERIPSLVLATLLVMLFVSGCRLLEWNFAGDAERTVPAAGGTG
jgi:hypothetical protein